MPVRTSSDFEGEEVCKFERSASGHGQYYSTTKKLFLHTEPFLYMERLYEAGIRNPYRADLFARLAMAPRITRQYVVEVHWGKFRLKIEGRRTLLTWLAALGALVAAFGLRHFL
jgi:hypothetical protein